MTEQEFFDSMTDASKVKVAIVEKYFNAWAKVILSSINKLRRGSGELAYIDLFSGPGIYRDGSESTPVKVVNKIIKDGDLREKLIVIFNDKKLEHIQNLEDAIRKLQGIGQLKYEPKFYNLKIGEDIINTIIEPVKCPALLFIDPCGYKGLSLEMIWSVLKGWGCDCLFFLNYNRINMALQNPCVDKTITDALGKDTIQKIRGRSPGLAPKEKEAAVIEEIASFFKYRGAQYLLPFRFLDRNDRRTSHYLILVTKHFKGYDIMKDIMAKESQKDNSDVPSFEYSYSSSDNQILFPYAQPLSELPGMLLGEFKHVTIELDTLYKRHSVGKPYTKKNYRSVLNQLEEEGQIEIEPKNRRVRNDEKTFGKGVIIKFP